MPRAVSLWHIDAGVGNMECSIPLPGECAGDEAQPGGDCWAAQRDERQPSQHHSQLALRDDVL